MSQEQQYDNGENDRRAADSCGERGDDWDLVLLCRNDRERFFPLLMKRHYALVVNMGYRFFSDSGTAEDLAQDVFLKVYHQLDSLHPGTQPFVHWLCRITSNGCRSLYRKRNSEKRALAAGKADFWFDGETTGLAGRIAGQAGRTDGTDTCARQRTENAGDRSRFETSGIYGTAASPQGRGEIA
jgi:RNA polymerase sigma factor (sigma-70 family)